MVLSYEQTILNAKKRVLSKLERYLADNGFSDGQQLQMLHDIERTIDEVY